MSDQNPREEQIDLPAEIQHGVERTEEQRHMVVRFLEQQGAQGRAERQCDHGGEAQRNAHGNGELHVDDADHAAVEHQRRIAGDRDERGGDDGSADLLHRLDGRLLGIEFLAFHQRLAVFHHDDGIVAQGPDHKEQPEHRQNVDAVAQGIQERHRADQGDGNRHGRDQRGAPVLQEHPGDQHHQRKRDDDGRRDLLHRDLDERGRIVGGFHRHACREKLLPFFQFGVDALHRCHGIGVRVAVHLHRHARSAVVDVHSTIGAGADFDLCDVAEMHDAAVRIMAQDDVPEFLGGLQAALDVQLERHEAVALFRADCSGRGLDVLRFHGL